MRHFLALLDLTSSEIHNLLDKARALKADLANFVKTRLAAHEYPREVEFVTELPLTTTGKIMRRELRRQDAERKAGR